MLHSLESLESRKLFSGATLANGVLTITGTNSHDTIEVALRDDGRLKVEVNNAEQEFTYSAINSFVINALGGNDSVEFNNANPIAKSATIRAGDGRDTVEGTEARDNIFGGGGADHLDGRGGSDVLYGDAGNDKLEGKAGRDKLFGGSGNDVLQGGAGDDSLNGNDGADDLEGDAGDDRLTGGRGNDDFHPDDHGNEIVDRHGDDDGSNVLPIVT